MEAFEELVLTAAVIDISHVSSTIKFSDHAHTIIRHTRVVEEHASTTQLERAG